MLYSEILADFIINLEFEKIPNEVISRAKDLMLDTLGVGLAGSKEEVVQNAINALKAMPNSNILSQIWGKNEKIDLVYASMINAISSHALDFDDTHTEAILHASSILTPLCLTYGFENCKDGKTIIKAFIVGWEIGARIGISSCGTFHKRGFHTTSICGVFASVSAACVILNLNKEQIINALGLAGSFASGINEFLSNGSNSKVLHVANAVKNGIFIANFAKNKMTGPRSIFEGRDNIFKTFGIEELCNKDDLTEGLNKIWQILQVSLKPYPSCHFAHGFIECALALRNDGLKSEDIANIKCFVDEVPINFICSPLEAKFQPKSDYEAKFSMPYLMALIFTDGYIKLNSYDNLNREEVLSFAKKINYEKHQSQGFPKYFPGHIEAYLKNGTIIKKDILINKGNFDNPLNKDEMKAKFLDCALLSIDEVRAKDIIEKINNLENLNSFEF